jgi:hypothetical protein
MKSYLNTDSGTKQKEAASKGLSIAILTLGTRLSQKKNQERQNHGNAELQLGNS